MVFRDATSKPPRPWRPAVAGLAAATAGIGLGELTAGLFAPNAGPILVIGAFIIDLSPAWLKELVIGLFGTADKAVLIVCIGLAAAVLAAVAGVLEFRRPPAGRIIVIVLGSLAVFAAVTRANATAIDALPSVVAMVVSAVLLTVFATILRGRPAPAPAPAPAPTPAADAAAAPPAAAAPAPAAAPPPDAAPDAAADAAAAPAADAAPPAPPDAAAAPAADAAAANAANAVADANAAEAEAAANSAAGLDRRRFLAWTGVSAGIGILALGAGQLLQAGARAADAARARLTLPPPAVPAAQIPAGASLDVPGLTPLITPNGNFYRIDTALQVPRIDASTWTLKITGMVDNEVEIDFAELLALPLEESTTTLACVSNEVGGDLIGNATWLGYPIRELLARARPHGDADMVLSRSEDGWTAGTPLVALTDDRNAILAVGMNGVALPLEHGYPVRMVVPGLYGYVSATKWVVELKLTRFDREVGYWTPRGWSALGPIKLSSRIDVPRAGTTLPAGPVTVAGVAWAQHTGIDAVQVQVDDGAWADAILADAISADTWRQWRWSWDAPAGEHTLRVRATDADGLVQTSARQAVAPDGATGLHEVTIRVE